MAPSLVRSAAHPARAFWLRWTLYMAAGELLGFGFVAAFLTPLAALAAPEPVVWLASIPAGAVEGAAVGLAQWLVLRSALPALSRNAWTAATALGAMLAYALAYVMNVAAEASGGEFTSALIAVLAVAGLLFLLSMGGAQWFILRRHVARAGWWIAANTAAWPLGVLLPVISIALVPDGAPLAVSIVAGATGGVLMGLTVGALTGAALVRLLAHKETT
jgi:hypothetical protein